MIPVPSQTARGFIGHEQLDDVGLVHMNGRVYGPLFGRSVIDGYGCSKSSNRLVLPAL